MSIWQAVALTETLQEFWLRKPYGRGCARWVGRRVWEPEAAEWEGFWLTERHREGVLELLPPEGHMARVLVWAFVTGAPAVVSYELLGTPPCNVAVVDGESCARAKYKLWGMRRAEYRARWLRHQPQVGATLCLKRTVACYGRYAYPAGTTGTCFWVAPQGGSFAATLLPPERVGVQVGRHRQFFCAGMDVEVIAPAGG